ncbi:MAG: carbon storage regulator [Candidatus Eisenbacteria bacterium]|nr:carbon storage regulator [Candidatus Eisenbacteria bacterium]
MLVIARRVGESLRIGPDIVLVIREVQGKQVRIAIEAPQSVAVARGELFADGKRDGAPVPAGGAGSGGGDGS